MKSFKGIIYNCLVAVFAITLITLSLITTQSGSVYTANEMFDTEKAYEHAEYLSAGIRSTGTEYHDTARKYILDQIDEIGYVAETQEFETQFYGLGDYYEPYTARNILVEINSSAAGGGLGSVQTVLITTSYDSGIYTYGANSNAVAVGAMLETLNYIKSNNVKFENKIIFLFADASDYDNQGFRHFVNDRMTKENTKFIGDFSSIGTSGSLNVIDTLGQNANFTKELTSLDGNMNVSSLLIDAYTANYDKKKLDIISSTSIVGATFSNIGARYEVGTMGDTIDKVEKSYVNQVGTVMNSICTNFGNTELDLLVGDSSVEPFFSVLGMFNIYFSGVFVLVFGILLIGILIAGLLINRDTKAYNFKDLGIATGCIVVVGGAVLALMLVLNLLLNAFGMASNASLYQSIPLIFVNIFGASCISIIAYYFIQKHMEIDARHLQCAGALIITFVSALVCFIVPNYAYIVCILAPILGIAFIVKTLFDSNKTMAKINLYSLAIVLTIPITFVSLFHLTTFYGSGTNAYMASLVAVLLSTILPSLANKSIKVKNTKVKINYIAFSAVALATMLVFTIYDGVNSKANLITANVESYTTPYYDNALIFVDDNTTNESYINLYDKNVYNFVKGDLDFDLHEDDYYTALSDLSIEKTANVRLISHVTSDDGNTSIEIKVEKAFEDSQYILTLPTFKSLSANLSIAVEVDGEDINSNKIYTGSEEYLNVYMTSNASIHLTYSSSDIKFENILYREMTSSTEYLSSNSEYSLIKDIEGLRVISEIRQYVV